MAIIYASPWESSVAIFGFLESHFCIASSSRYLRSYFDLQSTNSQSLGNTTIPPPNVPTDVFRIERCGHRKAGLAGVLKAAMAAIPPALEDVQLGVDSPHRFRAFFKYDGAKQYVHDILRQILTHEPKSNLLPNPDRPTPPVFACAQEASTRYHPWLNHIGINPWSICTTTPQAAFTVSGTSYIWLCPGFFILPTKPKNLSGWGCPTIEKNLFVTHDPVELYQTYIAIHEMVHFYLQTHSLSGITDPQEQYSMNGCVGLRPMSALHNPTSYQTYVASMLSFLLSFPRLLLRHLLLI